MDSTSEIVFLQKLRFKCNFKWTEMFETFKTKKI